MALLGQTVAAFDDAWKRAEMRATLKDHPERAPDSDDGRGGGMPALKVDTIGA
jgi:hypothetical protein